MRPSRLVTAVLAVVAVALSGLFAGVGTKGAGRGVSAHGVDLSALVLGGTAHAQRRRSLMRSLFGRRGVRRRAVRRRSSVRRGRSAVQRRRAAQARAARARARARRRAAGRQRAARQRASVRRAARRSATRNRAVSRARLRRNRSVVRRAAPAVAAGAAAGAATAAVDPDETVPVAEPRKVLVIGDFYARATAWGMERLLDENIEVVQRTTASSGLVRDDIVDWSTRIGEIVEEEKPDYVIFQIGANDRQTFKTPEGDHKPREGEWDRLYRERVEAVGMALKKAGVRFAWIGLPPMRFSKMNRDFVVINQWYGAAARKAGGRFVDVWDGFTDEAGQYVRSGPNVAGRTVPLRNKNGITMTRHGREKLGWYAAEIVRPALAGPKVYTALPSIDLGAPVVSKKVYNPARTGRTNVVRLSDPARHGTSALAGADVAGDLAGGVATAPPSAAAPTGRADDRRWSR